MKKESLTRANEIEEELNAIKENRQSLDSIDNARTVGYYLSVSSFVNGPGWQQKSVFPFDNSDVTCDSKLMEDIREEMRRAADNIQRVLDKRVKQLEQEFEKL